ncbi:MAG: TetR/AcrR family transcriptional regulator [Deltaproteobacteria bacterium]|nr:TetR/AcrR family transcriptional regulator [Deltaproteobacteria bacterium]
MKSGRAYQQTARAQKTAESLERILDEAEALFFSEPFDRVTLDAVARAAGVSIPTLQRNFGNKEGLFAAVGGRMRARVEAERRPPRMTQEARPALLDHYERDGRTMWHLLRQEADVPLLHAGLDEARAVHRAWVGEVFACSLAALKGAERERRLDALVAATDLYVWKLLRVDLGRTRQQVGRTMTAMALAVARGER